MVCSVSSVVVVGIVVVVVVVVVGMEDGDDSSSVVVGAVATVRPGSSRGGPKSDSSIVGCDSEKSDLVRSKV